MKKTGIAILLISALLSGCSKNQNGIKITGEVTNSNQEYVILAYQPLYRGNLNFDGFQTVGDRIDKNGKFALYSDKITHSADYWIQVKNKSFHLILFNGDNLTLSFVLNNLDNSLFARGKGAGKINVLRLNQFDYDLNFDPKYTMDGYKARVDSVIGSQLSFLEAIYRKEISNDLIQKAKNKQAILKIIRDTPLSEMEYEFLKKKISFQDVYNLPGFLSFLCEQNKADTSKIDFANAYFNCFNTQNYKKINNINYHEFEYCISKILKVEYLKTLQQRDRSLTYKNWNSAIKEYPAYRDWCFTFAKNNFSPEVFEKYLADELLFEMTTGDYNEDLYNKLMQNCSNKKYLNRIFAFNELIKNGLSNPRYDLDNDKFTLDSLRFNSLLKSYNGYPVYMVIWSARFAGASLISELPSVIDFEKKNRGKTEVINLCIDKLKYKGLWAARIIDSSWKGTHYFLPSEGNEGIIKLLSAKNIWGFCDGGATYSYIDGNGKITNNCDAPILMAKEKVVN